MSNRSICTAGRMALRRWNPRLRLLKRHLAGEFLDATIPAMAAAYLFHICQNHPFIDGNKRTGANAAVTFLLLNDWEPSFGEDELTAVVLSVASGEIGKSALAEEFESRCRPL